MRGTECVATECGDAERSLATFAAFSATRSRRGKGFETRAIWPIVQFCNASRARYVYGCERLLTKYRRIFYVL